MFLESESMPQPNGSHLRQLIVSLLFPLLCQCDEAQLHDFIIGIEPLIKLNLIICLCLNKNLHDVYHLSFTKGSDAKIQT